MKYSSLITLGVISIILAACGSGGGGSSAPKGGELFKKDMEWLSTSSMMSGKSVDGQMNGALTKAFGGTTNSDVSLFIEDRIKYVYSLSEAANFSVLFYENASYLGTMTVARLFGHENEPSKRTLLGLNAGAGLAHREFETGYDLKVELPEGRVDAGSFRLGLVFLTKNYSTQIGDKGRKYGRPREGRVSILVHEARHSDCPSGYGEADCGFSHRECTSGDMAGLPACDDSFWGPYAMGALYLKATQNNHLYGSVEYRIIEFMADDALSRLDSAQKNALYNSEPELNSF